MGLATDSGMQRGIFAAAMSAVMAVAVVSSDAAQRPGPVGRTLKPTPVAAPAKSRTAKRKMPALSPVQQKLQQNASLAGMVSGRLPAGADLMTVSAGFRDLGEFVATVNASNNLGIPFPQLKRRMVNDGMSLGLAIQDVRPTSRYWSESRRAEDEAARLIQVSEAAGPVTDQREPPRAKPKPARPGSRGVA
jgi:hypothetical protein